MPLLLILAFLLPLSPALTADTGAIATDLLARLPAGDFNQILQADLVAIRKTAAFREFGMPENVDVAKKLAEIGIDVRMQESVASCLIAAEWSERQIAVSGSGSMVSGDSLLFHWAETFRFGGSAETPKEVTAERWSRVFAVLNLVPVMEATQPPAQRFGLQSAGERIAGRDLYILRTAPGGEMFAAELDADHIGLASDRDGLSQLIAVAGGSEPGWSSTAMAAPLLTLVPELGELWSWSDSKPRTRIILQVYESNGASEMWLDPLRDRIASSPPLSVADFRYADVINRRMITISASEERAAEAYKREMGFLEQLRTGQVDPRVMPPEFRPVILAKDSVQKTGLRVTHATLMDAEWHASKLKYDAYLEANHMVPPKQPNRGKK